MDRVAYEGGIHLKPMSREEAINVRIRCGETTLEAQFEDSETVETFKKRAFGEQIVGGRKCRLIGQGRELRDWNQMGFYHIDDGSCLHVMIGPKGSAAGTAHAALTSNVAESPQQQQHQHLRPIHESAGFAVLFSITMGIVVSDWVLFLIWPKLFSAQAIALLLLLTCFQMALFLPFLKTAVVTAALACFRWRGDFQSRPTPSRRSQ